MHRDFPIKLEGKRKRIDIAIFEAGKEHDAKHLRRAITCRPFLKVGKCCNSKFKLDCRVPVELNGPAVKCSFNSAMVLRIYTALIAVGLAISTFGQPIYTPTPRRTASPAEQKKPPAQSKSPLPLKVASGVVQKTLAEYQKKAEAESLPKLDSAEFNFKVQTEVMVGGGISVWIFTLGASRTEGHVNNFTFTYSVPKPSPSPGPKSPGGNRSFSITDVGAMDINTLADTDINVFADALAAGTTTPKVDVEKFDQELLKAITDAAQTVKDVPSIGNAEFKEFAVTIEYSVKYEGNASGNIPIFSFLMVTPKLGANRNSVHSVKLVFKKEPVTPTTSPGPAATPSP
jgi:hypothetical protein